MYCRRGSRSRRASRCVLSRFLEVTVLKSMRGVRLKWCYYPMGTKYDLIYRQNEPVTLVLRSSHFPVPMCHDE